MERTMGVFTRSIIALMVIAPWRERNASRVEKAEAEGARHEERLGSATRMTGWREPPSTSVLRPDLEAIRRRPY
jgi:hypothetical protein